MRRLAEVVFVISWVPAAVAQLLPPVMLENLPPGFSQEVITTFSEQCTLSGTTPPSLFWTECSILAGNALLRDNSIGNETYDLAGNLYTLSSDGQTACPQGRTCVIQMSPSGVFTRFADTPDNTADCQTPTPDSVTLTRRFVSRLAFNKAEESLFALTANRVEDYLASGVCNPDGGLSFSGPVLGGTRNETLALVAIRGFRSVARPTSIRVQCGDTKSSFTDPSGLVWEADNGFTGGGVAGTDLIQGTDSNELLRKARQGVFTDFSYSFPVGNGSYEVRLRFAEFIVPVPGLRVFNVKINGSTVLSNFDILTEVLFKTALEKTFPVEVTDEQIDIVFEGVKRRGIVSAIEIEPAP